FFDQRRGPMRVVLAEKPSVARELASFLGASSRRDGYFEGRGYQVTWALGHLAMLKEPEDYDPALRRWSLETLPIVPEHFGLKLIPRCGRPVIDETRLGDCPRCGRPVIEGKRGFGCSGWKEGCPFVLWREYRGCPL